MTAVLLADVGGTHARFALADGAGLQPVHAHDVADYDSPEAAIGRFLEHHAAATRVERAVIAAAGPVADNRCKLTNGTWVLDGAQIASRFGLSSATVINDLEALGWAVPRLGPQDCRQIGGGQAAADAPIAVIAPGTGLGMACVIPGAPPIVLASEGGHAGVAASDDLEAAVVAVLRKRHGHVSLERVLSGQGVENLHAALLELDGLAAATPRAPDISRAARAGDRYARRTIDLFCSLLGSAAGDLALTFAARGGVYIGGGIVPGMVDRLLESEFRRRFERKGRLAEYVERIPTRVIVRADPAFLGLAALAQSPQGPGDLASKRGR